MASLLPEVLYETCQQAAAPCKDYHQLTVSQTEVVFRSWRLSCPRRHETAQPTQKRKSHQEFLQDTLTQGHVRQVFGPQTLGYVMDLCQHRYDYIVRLPDWALLKILFFLDWAEIKSISQTCKRLQQLCCSDGFWARGSEAGARFGRSAATMEGVSPALQRRLVVFHRKQVLSRMARQTQGRKTSVWAVARPQSGQGEDP